MKRTTRASRAPGSWSVGMMRAHAASIVSHSWSVKNRRLSSSGWTGPPTVGQSALLIVIALSSAGDREPLLTALGVELGDVLAGAPGVGHHRQRRIDAGRGREARAVDDVEVRHVVGLAPLVEHGLGGIGAHAGRAVLVACVAGAALEVEGDRLARAPRLEDLGVLVDLPLRHRQVVGMRAVRDP